MADSAETLLATSESVMSYTELMESIPCPKFSRLPLQTLDRKTDTHATASMPFDNLPQEPEDFTLSELKKELDMDLLISTEVLEDSDDSIDYPPAAAANKISSPSSHFDNNFITINDETDELISCNRSQSDVDKLLQPVASSSSNWREDGCENPSTVGAGLANLGNTCFFNAVLQCFTHSVLLIQGLYSNTHPTPCDCTHERFCLICTLREHIELSLSSTKKTIYPWKFIDNLTYFSSSFQRYQQEDAHEFLQCFLDRFESSFNKTKDDGPTQTGNLVKRVFGGRVISKLRCCNCNHVSDTFEPSVDLSLEIGDVNSLSTALESFTKVEHIEDEEMKFTCDKCKQKVSVEKQLLLDQIPLICAFHLKRFKNDGSYVEKIDKHVEFPLEFDLQPYTCDSQTGLKYELYAVVVHAAFTSSCGHYYCYIRFAPDTWYKFDDSKVTSVSEAHVLSEEAYILFYAKQGTPWFSKFMETYKPSFYPNLLSPKSVLENVDPPSIQSDVVPVKPIVNVIKKHSPLILKEHGSNHKTEVQKNTCVTRVNDSKNIVYIDELLSDDENSEVVFDAKSKQLKRVEKATFKRQRNNEVEDSTKREAMKMCKKMPGSRGALLMAAMSSKSENSLVKKSKKMTSSPRKNGCKSNGHFNSANRKLGRFSFP